MLNTSIFLGCREEAGELGHRRIGTVEFLKNGTCPTTFFTFAFFFIASDSSGNNQLSFYGAGELYAELA